MFTSSLDIYPFACCYTFPIVEVARRLEIPIVFLLYSFPCLMYPFLVLYSLHCCTPISQVILLLHMLNHYGKGGTGACFFNFELDHERCKQTLTYSALSTCQFMARGSCIVAILILERIKTNKIGDWAVLLQWEQWRIAKSTATVTLDQPESPDSLLVSSSVYCLLALKC